MAKVMRAALYLRVSTDKQFVENQRRALEEIAAARGWKIVATYTDNGISGSKGRDERPGLDTMLKDAVRHKFDVCMSWAMDRLGRSTIDLLNTAKTLESAGVDLFLHEQAIDTTTPAGKLFFTIMAAIGEFERSMIVSRINAGLARVKEEQAAGKVRIGRDGKRRKAIGRPRVSAETEAKIREHLAAGTGMLKTAKLVGVGSGTVQKIARG